VRGPSYVAGDAERRKICKYPSLLYVYIFSGCCWDTRCCRNRSNVFLHEVGRRIQFFTQEKRLFSFLMQRLSVAIQRGNAATRIWIIGSLFSATLCSLGWTVLYYFHCFAWCLNEYKLRKTKANTHFVGFSCLIYSSYTGLFVLFSPNTILECFFVCNIYVQFGIIVYKLTS